MELMMYYDAASSTVFSCVTDIKVEIPCDTSIDIKNVQSALSFVFESLDNSEPRWQDLRTTWDIESIRITHVSGEIDVLPAVYRVIIFFHASDKPYTVLLKVRNTIIFSENGGKENNSVAQKVKHLKPYIEQHERELKFYNEIATWAAIPVPAVYYSQPWDIPANKEGIIVMEDLIREGVRQNFYNGFNKEQVISIIRHLAQFHASTLWSENIDELLLGFPPLNDHRKSLKTKENLFDDIQKLQLDYFVKNAEALKRFLSKESESHLQKGKGCFRSVLAHGNLWTANVMFRKSWMGSACAEVRGFLNWQHCHEGSPLEDIARILVSSTNTEFRRTNTDELLRFYHEQLTAELEKKGRAAPFSLQEVKRMYDEQYPSQVHFLMLSHIPLLTVPELVGRATEEQKEMLQNRIQEAFDEIRLNYI